MPTPLTPEHLEKCESFYLNYRLQHCNDAYQDEEFAMMDALTKCHWYFLDEVMFSDSTVYNISWFSSQLFRGSPSSEKYLPSANIDDSRGLPSANIDDSRGLPWSRSHARRIMKKYKKYQNTLPRCGGIVLDKSLKYMLIVQSYYRKAWTFPQGKLEPGKALYHCAQSEIYEETGINVRYLKNYKNLRDLPLEIANYKSHSYITTLYFFTGVDIDTELMPQTKCEVCDYRWIPVDLMWRKSITYDFLEPIKQTFQNIFPEVRRRYRKLYH